MIGRIGLIVSLSLVLSTCAFAIVPPVGNVAPEEITLQYPPPNLIPVNTAPGGSIGLLKYLPDGTQVEIAGKVISALISGELQTTFYVQEADRSAGIRVTTPQYPSLQVGEAVNISGVLATVNGERVLQAGTITDCSLSSLAAPEPILLSLADIGGGPAGDYQPAVVLRVPTAEEPVGLKAVGINNVGLLVKIYGRVTFVSQDQTYFYVDDGSDVCINIQDTTHGQIDQNTGSDVWDGMHFGIMVITTNLTPEKLLQIQENGFVGVTGIVGTRLDEESRVLPLLQPRNDGDVSSSVSTVSRTSPADCIVPEPSGQVQYNLTCLPSPVAGANNPYPPQSDPMICEGYLWTYSGLHHAQIQPPVGSDPKQPLINFTHGTGYWLRQTDCSGISYEAVSDDATDRWISLPYPWYNLFGHPLNHDVLWSDLKVTDGKRMAGMHEAAFDLQWVGSSGVWWEPAPRSSRDIGLPDDYAYDDTLRIWHAYHMYAAKPVALIVPGTTYPPGPGIPARGSIAATVTDTNTPANPLIGARVYCKYGSALTTLPNGTALIEDLPPGEYLVTASAQGYKSKSQVIQTDPPVMPVFALESQSGFILWLTATPTRIPPNGTSTSTITAHVTDLEGAPLQGESVTITTDISRFVGDVTSITGSTSDQGILSATLVSLTTPNTATLTATCEGMTARTYVEFSASTAPGVRILSPTDGELVSDEIAVEIAVEGTPVGFISIGATLDGTKALSDVTFDEPYAVWRTYESSNGQHLLRAHATDSSGQTVYSPAVIVESSNNAFNVTLDREAAGDILGNSINLHAEQAGTGDWTVEIHQLDNPMPAKTFQGQGNSIDITWDGTDDSNQPVESDAYECIIQTSNQLMGMGGGTIIPLYWLRPYGPTALFVEGADRFKAWKDRMRAFRGACHAQGMDLLVLPYKAATWENFAHFMSVYHPRALYVQSRSLLYTALGHPYRCGQVHHRVPAQGFDRLFA